MSRPVYSKCLFAGEVPLYGALLLEGDDLNTYVVRDILVSNEAGSPGWSVPLGGFQITDDVGCSLMWVRQPDALLGVSYHWEGRYVLAPTGQIFGTGFDVGWRIHISGYLLTP